MHVENIQLDVINTTTDRLRAGMAHNNACSMPEGEPFKSNMTSHKQEPTESQST